MCGAPINTKRKNFSEPTHMIRVATFHFHEIARVLSNPSRHYGGVQWVFSPPVHCLPFAQNRLEYDTWLILVNAVLHDFTIGTLLHVPYGKILESTASEAITLAVCLDYLALSVHTPRVSQRVMKACSIFENQEINGIEKLTRLQTHNQ